MCPSAPRVYSEPGGQKPELSLSLDLISIGLSAKGFHVISSLGVLTLWSTATLKYGSCFAEVMACLVPSNYMMTSSNGNIFRVTGPLCGEFTGPVRGTKKGGEFTGLCARINDWVNNREAGDFRRHRGHYDVNVMYRNQCRFIACRIFEKESYQSFDQPLMNHTRTKEN